VSTFTFDLSVGADLLVCDVTAAPGVSAAALERAVVTEVDAVINDGVSDAELERAKILITTELVSALQSAQTRADRLSMFATYCGDPHMLNAHAARYLEVSTSQVNEATQRICDPRNRLSLSYVPQQGEGS
jgi:predicted Zn-dependent peptidase